MLLHKRWEITQSTQDPDAVDALIQKGYLVVDKSNRLATIFGASFHLTHDSFSRVAGTDHKNLLFLSKNYFLTKDSRWQPHPCEKPNKQNTIDHKNTARIIMDV